MTADLGLAGGGVSLVGMDMEGLPRGRNSMCEALEVRERVHVPLQWKPVQSSAA